MWLYVAFSNMSLDQTLSSLSRSDKKHAQNKRIHQYIEANIARLELRFLMDLLLSTTIILMVVIIQKVGGWCLRDLFYIQFNILKLMYQIDIA